MIEQEEQEVKKTIRRLYMFIGIASINLIIAKEIIAYLNLQGINNIGLAVVAVITIAIDASLRKED